MVFKKGHRCLPKQERKPTKRDGEDIKILIFEKILKITVFKIC